MEMSIDIEFSTLEPNGLLIWQGDDTNFFAVVGRSKLISYILCTLTTVRPKLFGTPKMYQNGPQMSNYCAQLPSHTELYIHG